MGRFCIPSPPLKRTRVAREKKNGEVGSYKEPPSGPLMSDNPLLVGVFPLLTLSHRPRTRCVTQEVWERGRGVRGDADGPSAKLIPRVSCQSSQRMSFGSGCLLTVEALSNSKMNHNDSCLQNSFSQCQLNNTVNPSHSFFFFKKS